MRKLTFALAAALFALVAFSITPAQATVRCSGCDVIPGAPANFLGNFNPFTSDQASFTHTAIPDGAISDWWIFNVAPAGLGAVNAIFLPITNITGFHIDLFSLTSATCAPPTGGPPPSNSGACGAFTTGALVASDAGAFFLNVPLMALGGLYGFHITGTASGGISDLYSGNVTTTAAVPEPGTVLLLGMGLLAAGFASRRKRV